MRINVGESFLLNALPEGGQKAVRPQTKSRRRRRLNIRPALRSSNSRRPRHASFALLVVSMGGLGGGGATIIQAGSHSTFFVTLS